MSHERVASATFDQATDHAVGTSAFWAVASASLIAATLFSGVGAAALVLGGIGIVSLAHHQTHTA